MMAENLRKLSSPNFRTIRGRPRPILLRPPAVASTLSTSICWTGPLPASGTQTIVYTDANGTLTLPSQFEQAIKKAFTLPAVTNANNGHIDWSYSIADSDLDFLAAGETLILTSEIVLSDGTLAAGKDLKDTTTVQITITGTNDAPTITAADTSGAVAEDGTQTALGTIMFKDVDLTNTHTVTDALTNGSVTSTLPGFDPAATRLGTLSLVVNEDNTDTDNIGTVGWTFTSDNDLAQQLAEGQAVTQVYTVTIKDTNDATATQDVTVTIAGTNDMPVVTSNAQAVEIVQLANGHN